MLERENKSSILARDGYELLTESAQIAILDPIFGGQDAGLVAESVPTRGVYHLRRMFHDKFTTKVDKVHKQSFYYAMQMSPTQCVATGFGLAFIIPRLMNIHRYCRIFLLAMAGVAVYPIYKLAGPNAERTAFTAFYPSNGQMFRYAWQRFAAKFSPNRMWEKFTGRVNFVSPPAYAIARMRGKEQTMDSWFNLRIRNKTEKGFHDLKYPQAVITTERLDFTPKEFFYYYQKKLFDCYDKHPLKKAADDLRIKYQFTGETITMSDRWRLFREYMGPQRYFLRFMSHKYLGPKYLRHMKRRYLRILPFVTPIVALGLWIIPYPFRECTPHTLGYVYVFTLYVIYRVLKRWHPADRQDEARQRFPDLFKPTPKQRLMRFAFGAFAVMSLAKIFSIGIAMVEGARWLDPQIPGSHFPEQDQDKYPWLPETPLFDRNQRIDFGAILDRLKESYARATANYHEFKNRTSLRYEIEQMYDPKNIFPPEEGGKPKERMLTYTDRWGEEVEIYPEKEQVMRLKMIKGFFMGHEHLVDETVPLVPPALELARKAWDDTPDVLKSDADDQAATNE